MTRFSLWKRSVFLAVVFLSAFVLVGRANALRVGENYEPPAKDHDHDGVFDDEDNCPTVANPDQEDSDEDGLGDACDNCPSVANADQKNWNHDHQGDACQDTDGDGVEDDKDNCPDRANSDQADANNDHLGDACEDECPTPEITVTVTKHTCTWHKADQCDNWNPLEGDCDLGFDDGAPVVTKGDYTVHWESRNAEFVTEDCHNFQKQANAAQDSGDINFVWDGPWPYDPNQFRQGYHAWLDRFFNLVNPIATAWAGGYHSTSSDIRSGGHFDCNFTASASNTLAWCTKRISVHYSYSCPE